MDVSKIDLLVSHCQTMATQMLKAITLFTSAAHKFKIFHHKKTVFKALNQQI